MKAIQLIHFADTHIGVENYGRLDPASGLHTRLQDFSTCLACVIDTALEREVDAVLFAGDAYKHAAPSPTHEGKFAEQIKRLTDAHIPLIMVTGNHDISASFGKASALKIFGTLGHEQYVDVVEKPELKRIETKHGPFQVACFPWPTRHVLLTKEEYKNLSDDEITRTIEEKCANRIAKFARDLDPSLPSVLLAHLAVADAIYSGSERSTIIGKDPVILQSVLKNPAFEYVALGHIHKHQNLNRQGHPPIVYPGSIERIDFGEAKDPKGFCLVTLAKEATSVEFIETPARRFVKIEVDARKEAFPTECILKKIAAHPLQDAVVRVSYLITPEQKELIDVQKLYAALDGAFLIAGVTERTEDIRTQRPRIAEDLSLTETLSKYLDFTPELQSLRTELHRYAEDLIRELEQSE